MSNLLKLFYLFLLLVSATLAQSIYTEAGDPRIYSLDKLIHNQIISDPVVISSQMKVDSLIATGLSGGKHKTNFKFENGEVIEAVHYNDFGSGWEGPWKEVLDYDSLGKKILRKTQSLVGDSVWADDSRITYEYSEDGDLIQEVHQIFENVNWIDFFRTVINYTNDTKESISQSFDGDWVNKSRFVDYIDETGNLDSSFYYSWDGNEWLLGQKVIRLFNESDQLIYIDYYVFTDSNYRKIGSWEYIYNAEGNPEKLYYYEWDDNLPQLISRLTYHYNNEGLLFEIKNEVLENESWTPSQSDGIVIEITENYSIGFLYHKVNIFYSETTEINETEEIETRFELSQNYPNPFNPTTSIEYQVSSIGNVTLKVYDVLGREISTIVKEVKHPGTHEVTFDASELPSGVYFYRLTNGNYSATKKMVLMK